MVDSLVLDDGVTFEGTRFGASTGPVVGEVALYTGVVGWQEVLTDPAYAGKIVVFTYPHVGNYGVNDEDVESSAVTARGVVVRDLARFVSNFRATGDLRSWAERHGLVGLTGVDTRAVMIHTRECGAATGAIAANADAGLAAIREQGSPFDHDLVAEVQGICRITGTGTRGRGDGETRGHGDGETGRRGGSPLPLGEGQGEGDVVAGSSASHPGDVDPRLRGDNGERGGSPQPSLLPLAVLDLGGKRSLYQQLVDLGCTLHYFPWDATAEQIMSSGAAGVLLPPGPGDPNRLGAVAAQVGQLLGKVPVLGIGLGFQVLSLALGCRVVRLKAGRHGVNYPARSTTGGPSMIVACHQSFALDAVSVPTGVDLTYVDLNDGTPLGLQAREVGAVGYQFHPGRDPDNRPSPLLARFVATLVARGAEIGLPAGSDTLPTTPFATSAAPEGEE